KGLYDYAKNNGWSVGDVEAQVGYMIKELKRDFSGLYNQLRSSSYGSSYDYLTRQFMRRYEAPASPNTTKRVRKARSVYYSL
ncbi:MAG: phage tail tip lysozyme, partial [Lachnospiraceae bacterium]